MENIDLEEHVLTFKDIITLLETGKINSVRKESYGNTLTFYFTGFQYPLSISLERHDFWGGIDINVRYNSENIFKEFSRSEELEKIFKIYKNRKTNEAVKSLKQKIKELDNDEKIHLEKNGGEEDLI